MELHARSASPDGRDHYMAEASLTQYSYVASAGQLFLDVKGDKAAQRSPNNTLCCSITAHYMAAALVVSNAAVQCSSLILRKCQ